MLAKRSHVIFVFTNTKKLAKKLARIEASSSLLRRGLKGLFSGGVDPLSNVSAGTELQATAESAGASARYHTQDGRHPGETIFSELLSGVGCVPCVTVKMAGKISWFSDV